MEGASEELAGWYVNETDGVDTVLELDVAVLVTTGVEVDGDAGAGEFAGALDSSVHVVELDGGGGGGV